MAAIKKAPGKEVPSQAIVAEPPMVQILEARVVEPHGLVILVGCAC